MKFSKSMEELMVPEWSSQYMQYRVGKKIIKSVTAEINLLSLRANPSRNGFSRTRERMTIYAKDHLPLPHRWSTNAGQNTRKTSRPSSAPYPSASADIRSSHPRPMTIGGRGHSIPAHVAGSAPTSYARRGVEGPGEMFSRFSAYSSRNSAAALDEDNLGNHEPSAPESQVASSQHHSHHAPHMSELHGAEEDPLGALMLPDPIQPLQPLVDIATEANIPVAPNAAPQAQRPDSITIVEDLPPYLAAVFGHRGAHQQTRNPRFSSSTAAPTIPVSTSFLHRSIMGSPRPFSARVSSFFGGRPQGEVPTNADLTEALYKSNTEFQKWLLIELNKIESFYKRKEAEAVIRFGHMKEQLELLRLSWLKAHSQSNSEGLPSLDERPEDNTMDKQLFGGGAGGSENVSGYVPDPPTQRRIGWKSTIVAMTGLKPHDSVLGEAMSTSMLDAQRDYQRRRPVNNPNYRLAKSKLKRAFIEYYRRLELLKSYIRLNREAFGKITKKFDKASGLRTSSKFMNEHINVSYFGGSGNKLDDLINETEILFARFFMRSSRKDAAMRLRTRENKSVYHSAFFRSGLYLGSSVVMSADALWQAAEKVENGDSQTGYLLQLWGGIFLLILQVLLFAVNMRVWAKNKINYAFIFEFDAKYQLDHRQFLEIPAVFGMIFAICFWFSVYDFWPHQIDQIHFPIIFVSVAGAVLLNPIKGFYFRSRKFFLQTLARLMVSGFKRVEFRDFWISDLLCSQTYALGNISLFFCLYATSWGEPRTCDSAHSHLMGFFTTLPAILRCLQCIRRYRDSRQAFPHLANAMKYTFTILQYMMLSLWRMRGELPGMKAGFMTVATINSFYTIFWDIVMDWSLLNPYAKWPFVRDSVGFKNKWVYYSAMFVDPIIRFSWVFYIIYAPPTARHGTNDQQFHFQMQSARLSFIVALLEVLRRFMWSFFRVENEHVGNVGANRAYRDPRLPYRFPLPEHVSVPSPAVDDSSSPLVISSGLPTVDVERSHVRRRHRSRRRSGTKTSPAMQALERLGRTMTMAHTKDYERRHGTGSDEEDTSDELSSDEEEDDGDFYERTAGSGGAGTSGVRI